MALLKLSKDALDLFEIFGTKIITPDCKKYMYFPYWIHETDKNDLVQMLSLDALPKNVINSIKSMRGEKAINTGPQESFIKLFEYMFKDELKSYEEITSIELASEDTTPEGVEDTHILHHLLVLERYFNSL